MSKSLLRSVCLSLSGSSACWPDRVWQPGSGQQPGGRPGYGVYKIDIVQGNFVSREQAAALKPGMSRAQVRDILGTPLLTSVFHADRWDYVFTFKRQGVEPQVAPGHGVLQGRRAGAVRSRRVAERSRVCGLARLRRRTGKVPVLEMSPESLNATACATPGRRRQSPCRPCQQATRRWKALPTDDPVLTMTESTLHRICVAGASGRMGRMLIEAICRPATASSAARWMSPAVPAIGSDPAAASGHDQRE